MNIKIYGAGIIISALIFYQNINSQLLKNMQFTQKENYRKNQKTIAFLNEKIYYRHVKI